MEVRSASTEVRYSTHSPPITCSMIWRSNCIRVDWPKTSTAASRAGPGRSPKAAAAGRAAARVASVSNRVRSCGGSSATLLPASRRNSASPHNWRSICMAVPRCAMISVFRSAADQSEVVSAAAKK